MNQVAIIPAPVAAEISGAGSFFGSCQMAASNFESFLQTAGGNNVETLGGGFGTVLAETLGEASAKDDLIEKFKRFNSEPLNLEEKTALKELLKERYLFLFKKGEDEEEENLLDCIINMAKELGIEDAEKIVEFVEAVLDFLSRGDVEGLKSLFAGLETGNESKKEMFFLNLVKRMPEFEDGNGEKSKKTEQAELAQAAPIESTESTESTEEDIPEPQKLVDVELKIADVKPYIKRLADETGINSKDYPKFEKLVLELIDRGIIAPRDLVIPKEIKEEEKPLFVDNILDKIWKNVKKEDVEPAQSQLQQQSQPQPQMKLQPQAKELPQLQPQKQAQSQAQMQEQPQLQTQKQAQPQEQIREQPQIQTQKLAQPQESQPQPEVKAVWEGGGLKIEMFNPKTGEKLQSIPVPASNMQERIHEFEVVRQVVAKAKFITTPIGEQKLTIQLRPEHLGQLDLRITLNKGEMQIHAKVESAVAQQALENNIGLLREGLEKQGISLERLEVLVEHKDRQEQREQKHGKRKKHWHGRETHLAVSVANEKADTGRRLGYNTMEYLA